MILSSIVKDPKYDHSLRTEERDIIESSIKIVNKNGDVVPFTLNKEQEELDCLIANLKALKKKVRIIIPKARQRGVSAYLSTRGLIKVIKNDNVNARIVAHEDGSARKILSKVKFSLKSFNSLIKELNLIPESKDGIEMKYDTKTELHFQETGSTYSVYSAKNHDAARGDTTQYLHMSELAFWDDPQGASKSLMQAASPNAEAYAESTGNGAQTYYHRFTKNAIAQRNDWHVVFFPWVGVEEYSDNDKEKIKDILINPDLNIEEDILLDKGVSPSQILWRRNKIYGEFDGDMDSFKQEYPMDIDECFISKGGIYFNKIKSKVGHSFWRSFDKKSKFNHQHPASHLKYVIGVDPAGGTGNDNSVIEIVCINTKEQVYEYSDNRIKPDEFAFEVSEIAKKYNYGLVVIESNNHGLTVINTIEKLNLYDLSMLYASDNTKSSLSITDYGFKTNKATKRLYLGILRRMLANDIYIFSEDLISELNTFDSEELKSMAGCHDDRVMAMVMVSCGLDNCHKYSFRNDIETTIDMSYYSDSGWLFSQKNKSNTGQPVNIEDMYNKGYNRNRLNYYT